MLKYSFSWVIVVAILNALISTRFTGFGFFSRWNVWFSYLLILLVPLLSVGPQRALKIIENPETAAEPEKPGEIS